MGKLPEGIDREIDSSSDILVFARSLAKEPVALPAGNFIDDRLSHPGPTPKNVITSFITLIVSLGSPVRFPYPCYPAEFEIPDDWWIEADMSGFTPASASYLSSDPAAQIIRLREIEPPFRFPEHPKDFRGFDRGRMVRILSGFVAGGAIEPVPLLALPALEFQPAPFRYRLRDGFHRFHASVAAGFGSLPGIAL